MSNKKLSRLLEPNLKFYFAVMLLFAVAAIPVNWQLALAEGTLTVLLYFYFRQSNQKRRQGVLQYIDSVTGSVDTASKSTLINSPLPTLVFRPDTGEIIWSNESFLQLAGVREHLFEMRLSEAVPDFQVQWLLSGKQESPERVELNNHRFRVYGSLVRSRNRTGVQSLVATTYWVETTEADHLREVYEASRPVAAILMLDNYEDLMKACEDTQRSAVLAQIDEKLQTWANAGQGILLKTDRNHYLFLFEEQYFQHFVDEKFSILDTVRAIRVAENIHPTLSIGIGKDSPSIPELYKNAKLSLEMALSRGGDPGGGAESGGLRLLRRPHQGHGEADQSEIPRDGQRLPGADRRRGRGLHHGPFLCGYGRRGRCRGYLLRRPEAGKAGTDRH